MSASITLSKTVTETERGTVKLVLSCTATDVSPKVFAIEVLPSSADEPAPIYRFSHICSPAEMEEFPADVPGENCYFRTDSIEMIFDTPKILDHVITNVENDIAKLVRELNALDTLASVTTSRTFS
jgi:hypothetical protein